MQTIVVEKVQCCLPEISYRPGVGDIVSFDFEPDASGIDHVVGTVNLVHEEHVTVVSSGAGRPARYVVPTVALRRERVGE